MTAPMSIDPARFLPHRITDATRSPLTVPSVEPLSPTRNLRPLDTPVSSPPDLGRLTAGPT